MYRNLAAIKLCKMVHIHPLCICGPYLSFYISCVIRSHISAKSRSDKDQHIVGKKTVPMFGYFGKTDLA